MTEHSDTTRQAGLRDQLTDAAEDFFPASAPYDAIIGDARRRIRIRAIGGSALSVVALGAAVTVGVTSFTGTQSTTQSTIQSAAAPGQPAQAAPVHPGPKPLTTTPDTDHYGTTTIAQGDYDGVHWTLTRDLTKQNNVTIPSAPGTEPQKGTLAVDDVYFTAPNNQRDTAGAGGSTTPANLSALLNHFNRPNADIVAAIATTNLGVGAMDDPQNKEKPSPYETTFLSGIVSTKVARIQVIFTNGEAKNATLVPAPAGEDGQYFYLPFKNESWTPPTGTVVYYDAHGHVLKPQNAGFSHF